MSEDTQYNTTTESEAPSLGLQDIQNALKIIDFAADQGAFKGWTTVQQVMSVRNKIADFVAYAEANAETPTETVAAPVDGAEAVAV